MALPLRETGHTRVGRGVATCVRTMMLWRSVVRCGGDANHPCLLAFIAPSKIVSAAAKSCVEAKVP